MPPSLARATEAVSDSAQNTAQIVENVLFISIEYSMCRVRRLQNAVFDFVQINKRRRFHARLLADFN
jgi:hypothetical protein